jgi:dihydrofolate synthase/folylpolyglutamate synthase
LTYEEALAYLKGRERFGIKFGLENVSRLNESLGGPERRYQSILVAGTNGKGSTVALIESVLRASGHRTGRYTSPHIRFLEERIHVDGRPIEREELARSVERVADAAERLFGTDPDSSAPTFFEAVTAAAFLAFAEKNVEVAVLEVGMGGRFDATNVVPASVSVIAPVGFDHERFLGTTIAAIASEKAAIIKENRPVVVGRLHPDALAVVRREASLRNARLVEALEGVALEAQETEGGHRVKLVTPSRDYGWLSLPFVGAHQVDNLVLAIRALEEFGGEVSVESVASGVAATTWPGRLERKEGAPSLLFDAAHNVMAVEALARYLEAHPHPRRVLLFGVMKDKRVREMLDRLLPLFQAFVATRPEMSRARGPEQLARWARERGIPAESTRSPRAALERARALAGPDGEVVVAGSIFLLGEIEAVLERERVEPSLLVRAFGPP